MKQVVEIDRTQQVNLEGRVGGSSRGTGHEWAGASGLQRAPLGTYLRTLPTGAVDGQVEIRTAQTG
jgi:hypothetical protein